MHLVKPLQHMATPSTGPKEGLASAGPSEPHRGGGSGGSEDGWFHLTAPTRGSNGTAQ